MIKEFNIEDYAEIVASEISKALPSTFTAKEIIQRTKDKKYTWYGYFVNNKLLAFTAVIENFNYHHNKQMVQLCKQAKKKKAIFIYVTVNYGGKKGTGLKLVKFVINKNKNKCKFRSTFKKKLAEYYEYQGFTIYEHKGAHYELFMESTKNKSNND